MPTLPSAPLVYFQIKNLEAEEANFLNNQTSNPNFTYSNYYNQETINSAKQAHPGQGMDLVESSFKLQSDASELENFKRLNRELYGEPSKEIAEKIIQFFAGNHTFVSPEVFNTYREYLKQYFGDNFKVDFDNLESALTYYFRLSDLTAQGWRLKESSTAMTTRTISRIKTITYNRNHTSIHPRAYAAIALHEIYGHALHPVEKPATTNLLKASEGYAIFLEQLVHPNFRIHRSLRYLALSFAFGLTDGTPKNFRDTYNVLYDFCIKNSGKDYPSIYPKDIEHRVFLETARIFRGGRPDLPGAVFTKDLIYFEGNIAIWQSLNERPLQFYEFYDIIKGDKVIQL
ncbi:MAG: DUF1704 domain-containing protein [Candidatus Saccharibacteria bacterium]|nr:DUF1704 domain-containing protein [Candidatus Saccharibacteria bacterium]